MLDMEGALRTSLRLPPHPLLPPLVCQVGVEALAASRVGCGVFQRLGRPRAHVLHTGMGSEEAAELHSLCGCVSLRGRRSGSAMLRGRYHTTLLQRGSLDLPLRRRESPHTLDSSSSH